METRVPYERKASDSTDTEKGLTFEDKVSTPITAGVHAATDDASNEHIHLKRGLSSRHISLMTFSGVIGTGIFLSTGAALSTGGPLSLLLAFMLYSVVMWQVSQCVGEMATFIPMEGSLVMWANRFVNKAMGAATHYNYYYTTLTIACAEIAACSSALAMWLPDINPAAWVTIFVVLYVTANCLPSRWYGEVEFWSSIFKLILLAVLILTTFIFMVGGNPKGEAFGFRYWNNPGAMAEYIDTGSTGRLLAFWSCMASAAFTVTGPDYIAITSAEAVNPRRNIPKQVNRTAYRLMIVYWLAVIMMGVLVPYNSPELKQALAEGNGMGRSIFVVGLESWGMPRAFRHFANAMLITSAGSCGNAFYYASIRCTHSASQNGFAPRIFARTMGNGVPIYAVLFNGALLCLTYLSASASAAVALDWFISLGTLGLLITFTSVLVSWVYFNKALRVQGISRDSLPFKGKNMRFGPYIAIVIMIVIMLTSSFSVFTNGNWDVQGFICGYFGLAFYAVAAGLYWIICRPPRLPAEEVDLVTGKAEVDADEEWHRENTLPPRNPVEKFLDWLF